MIGINLIGRFGNCIFQYAFARALAEQRGEPLYYTPWIGQRIFDLPEPAEPNGVMDVSGYHQDQASLIYTRSQVKSWFKIRPEILAILANIVVTSSVVIHLRRGDYLPLGYVVVSTESYMNAVREYSLTPIDWTCMEGGHAEMEPELSFLPDFYRMMTARVLLRANSSFSWWAATLGDGAVYSPIVEGLEGGRVQECQFVPGNWPRLANFEFTTDLHLSE